MNTRNKSPGQQRLSQPKPSSHTQSQQNPNQATRTDWDAVADWYHRHMGPDGSEHHRRLALPATLELLSPRPGERILDLGAGQGVLAPHIAAAGAVYTGVEASPRLVKAARRHHGAHGRFLEGDACRLSDLPTLRRAQFDGAVFLLSLQDMDPLAAALAAAAWALRPGGRLVALLNHPCFRVPRQSGWGWDEGRQLRFRRVDRYLTPLAVPMPPHVHGQKGTAVRSFHRPLQEYVNDLHANGLALEALREIPTFQVATGPQAAAENRAFGEIPLFLGLRARKA